MPCLLWYHGGWGGVGECPIEKVLPMMFKRRRLANTAMPGNTAANTTIASERSANTAIVNCFVQE